MESEENVETLRARVAELEAALARAEHRGRKLEEIIDAAPGILWETEGELGTPQYRVTYVSRQVESILGYSREEWTQPGAFWLSRIHPEDKPRIAQASAQISKTGGNPPDHRLVAKDGRSVWVEAYVRVSRDASGAVTGRTVFMLDVSERKRAEEAEARLKDELIKAQAAVLAELGTPLIPISSEVLVMPLVGTIDAQRAERVLEALLHGVAKAAASVAIVDVTGVPSIDTQTAEALLRAARAVKLLGADVVLTGIRPEVAQTLVTLGVDLQGIVTRSTLEAGIAHATRPG